MSKAEIREMQPNERGEVARFSKPAKPGGETRTFKLVALVDGQVAGYAEMAPSFFQRQFISRLSVRPEHRRQGVATALMKSMETACKSGKLFTSTNLSNQPMQSLLAKMEYRLCGVVEELDEGDPELVFTKRLGTRGSTP